MTDPIFLYHLFRTLERWEDICYVHLRSYGCAAHLKQYKND